MRRDRWRRHWKLVVGYPVVLALLVGLFGASRVRAFSSSNERSAAIVTQDVRGTGDLFDTTVAHSIAVRFSDGDYRRMLDDYFTSGNKGFIEADAVIDGKPVRSVGLRLKGNATLFALRSSDGRTAPRAGPAAGFGAGPPGAGPGGAPSFGTSLGTEAPETLPWLVSFDEFVKGRRYQGQREIAIRPAQNVTRTTVLNEAFSFAALASVGEMAPAHTYVSFQVNERTPALRLVVQNPGESMTDAAYGVDGALYKALSGGRFEDRGDDPLAYATSFRQLTGRRHYDLQPVISFIRWVGQASDAEFDAGLAARLDVESFARYAALQNLLLNFDDMAGPGQNYLLFYDGARQRFSVGAWDMNLALSGSATQGPFDAGRFGGGGAGGPGGLGGNPLKQRFLASATFKPLYERTYRDLYQRLFMRGGLAAIVDSLVAELALVPAELAPRANLDADVTQVRSFVTGRTKGLANNPVIIAS